MRWGAFIASGEAVAVARIARVAADFMFGYSWVCFEVGL